MIKVWKTGLCKQEKSWHSISWCNTKTENEKAIGTGILYINCTNKNTTSIRKNLKKEQTGKIPPSDLVLPPFYTEWDISHLTLTAVASQDEHSLVKLSPPKEPMVGDSIFFAIARKMVYLPSTNQQFIQHSSCKLWLCSRCVLQSGFHGNRWYIQSKRKDAFDTYKWKVNKRNNWKQQIQWIWPFN